MVCSELGGHANRIGSGTSTGDVGGCRWCALGDWTCLERESRMFMLTVGKLCVYVLKGPSDS